MLLARFNLYIEHLLLMNYIGPYLSNSVIPQTTIISIAHRSTVKRHHDNVLFFKVNDQKEVQVEERGLSGTVALSTGLAKMG